MQGKVETRVGIFVLAAIGVFMYMGFKIGAFRFDRARYTQYVMHFNDISGLSRKADLKIAGVKVGWVEEVNLLIDHEMQAEAKVMVLKDYSLYADAYAIVRQDGLLGPKYIEVIPGDSLLPRLEPGESLRKPSIEPVNIDELMHQFKNIASHVEEVTESFKEAVGGIEGKDQLKSIFDDMHNTIKSLSSFSDILDRSFRRNEENIDALLQIGDNFNRVTHTLEKDVFPTFQESIEKISDVFDRDFNRVASKVELTAEAFEQASIQARDGLRSISSVAEKIDEGQGLIGKLINEDETYNDLRIAVQGFKNYLAKIDRLQIVFDSHFETMHRPAENFEFEDSKGYFNIRLCPNEDHFYQVQLATSQKGFIERWERDNAFFDHKGRPVDLDQIRQDGTVNLDLTDLAFLRQKRLKFKRNTVKLGLQFGKVFGDIAFRFGLFEGSAGLGMDIDIPFGTDKFRWVTTFEMFDFVGWNRKDDRRPHFKWLNRMYVMQNLYVTFGADDFASKRNASAFIGGGLRFGDDDVKYLFSNISGAAGPNFVQS